MSDALPQSTEATRLSISQMSQQLPWHDETDFEDVRRGFIARSETRQVVADDGRVVWDLDAYQFLQQPCPDTANPSLWRQGQLLAEDGLFEVTPGIYQVRGYDLSVMSVIEGDEGVIVIDPLISKETAAAAFALYQQCRGPRVVTGMIYTHSHIDHFGGVKGIISEDDVTSGRVPVIAPQGFMDEAVSENVFAGTAMGRRAGYMYGAALAKGPAGQIGAGLGLTTSTGEPTLIPPTVDITHTGQTLVIDGVEIVFQITPGTEAPAEMNFYFPHHRALCTAENTSHTLHNILTLRGAQVRDASGWAAYLTETISLWGDQLDLVFASHHWPTWGRDRSVDFLSMQRDVYAYLHDQTLRLMNQGWTGTEIAEQMQLPPALEAAWHVHGYYGSVSHNVKAIYQRYMGWYEGNPARLWRHTPTAAGRRYVAAMGGADAAVAQAQTAFDEGDYRWAAEILDHVLFADENLSGARELQAAVLEQLGFGAENGTWRNAFLSGAAELRGGIFGTPASSSSPDLMAALTVDQIISSLAIRVDGPRAWDMSLVLCFTVTDEGKTYVVQLRNGVLSHWAASEAVVGATNLTLSRHDLIAVLTGEKALADLVNEGSVSIDGDPDNLAALVQVLSPVDPNFAIVTP
jgi:alkyl sulfatase BDS1-like metallo-beta-lactamase superfamily hydrolase